MEEVGGTERRRKRRRGEAHGIEGEREGGRRRCSCLR